MGSSAGIELGIVSGFAVGAGIGFTVGLELGAGRCQSWDEDGGGEGDAYGKLFGEAVVGRGGSGVDEEEPGEDQGAEDGVETAGSKLSSNATQSREASELFDMAANGNGGKHRNRR